MLNISICSSNARLEYKTMALPYPETVRAKNPGAEKSLRKGSPCDPGDRVAGPCARHRRHHDAEADQERGGACA